MTEASHELKQAIETVELMLLRKLQDVHRYPEAKKEREAGRLDRLHSAIEEVRNCDTPFMLEEGTQ